MSEAASRSHDQPSFGEWGRATARSSEVYILYPVTHTWIRHWLRYKTTIKGLAVVVWCVVTELRTQSSRCNCCLFYIIPTCRLDFFAHLHLSVETRQVNRQTNQSYFDTVPQSARVLMTATRTNGWVLFLAAARGALQGAWGGTQNFWLGTWATVQLASPIIGLYVR